MSKRLTDSAKYQHPWFRKLPGNYKLAFYALLDLCDCAGVWRVDLEDLEYRLKAGTYDWQDFLAQMDGRIVPIDGDRWQIRDYIAFQYGTLNPTGKNRVHASVIKALRSHGIDPSPYFSLTLAATVDSTVGPTVKEKEKAKEKVKDSISAPDPDPAEVFANATVPAGASEVKFGPHEAAEFVRSKSVKVWKDDAPGWARLMNKYGQQELGAALEAATAADKKDINAFEGFIQGRAKRRKEAERMAEVRERAHEQDRASRASANDQKRRDAASKEPWDRVCAFLEDQNSPEMVRLRALECDPIKRGLAWIREGKYSALMLGTAIRMIPELKDVAYPMVTAPTEQRA